MRFARFAAVFITLFATVFTFATLAEAKRVDISISKVSQKMTVRVDGQVEYVWPVSTGAAQYETPSGTFRPFRMEAEHFSKEWDDAPMPHSIFFTGEGHAIHGSFHVRSLGRKASHGCVRLAPENATILFDLVQSAGMSNTSISLKGGFFDFGYQPKRSFADVGAGIDKVITRSTPRNCFFCSAYAKPKVKIAKIAAKKAVTKKAKAPTVAAKKPVVKPAMDLKNVAEKAPAKCIVKDTKKPCKKPLANPAAAAG